MIGVCLEGAGIRTGISVSDMYWLTGVTENIGLIS